MSKASDAKFERNLALYTLAAAATLAAGHPAQAEVIFTPSSAQFTGTPINIDMDNDGTVDFVMQTGGSCNSSTPACYIAWGVTQAPGASGNGVAIDYPSQFEAALTRGNHIGRPNDHFPGRFYARPGSRAGGPGHVPVQPPGAALDRAQFDLRHLPSRSPLGPPRCRAAARGNLHRPGCRVRCERTRRSGDRARASYGLRGNLPISAQVSADSTAIAAR